MRAPLPPDDPFFYFADSCFVSLLKYFETFQR